MGNRTKAIRLTEVKTQAAMADEHNSSLKEVFLFSLKILSMGCGETTMFHMLCQQKLSLFIASKLTLDHVLFSIRY